MKKIGEVFIAARSKKRLSLKKAASDLLIKTEHLEALEKGNYRAFEDTTFIKANIKSYSNYLGLDPEYTLALFRREFDEKKYSTKGTIHHHPKKFLLTPTKVINFVSIFALFAFLAYLGIQYFQILSAPNLEVYTPQNNEATTVKVINVSGKTETESTVVVNGKFISVTEQGNFSYQYNLEEGKNTIEIIASKRLSPKTKITRTVRLIN